jgi:eukaryotic-like serine/threonine-protein kinase
LFCPPVAPPLDRRYPAAAPEQPEFQNRDGTAAMRTIDDRYEIVDELGRGGMATVYRARDLRHGRDVAIKVMRPEVAAAVGSERFLREIGIAARLQHPQIVPVFDSGEHDGQLFYVMPLIEGESLAQRLRSTGLLPLEEAVRLAGEVAEALDYAHGEGVLHRDLKPANILLSRGHALLTDFGLARAQAVVGEQDETRLLTQPGTLLGTPLYASPEQVQGETELGPAADVYGLASVLFELLTGKAPFSAGNVHSLLARRLVEDAPRLSASGVGVPPACDEAVARALARDPRDRFRSAGEFVAAVRGAAGGVASPTPGGERSIAVIPFDNLSPDAKDSYLADGLTEEIIADLSRLPSLRVIARNSSTAARQRTGDLREIARLLDVRYLLEGSVRRSDRQLRITAQLIDGATDSHVWAEKYRGTMDDVFAMQESIAGAIADELRVRIGDGPRRANPVTDIETYELYLRARYLSGQSVMRMPEALACLEQAIARDPAFAPALTAMGTVLSQAALFGVLPARPTWNRVRELAERAVALDPALGVGYELLGSVAANLDWDWDQASRLYAEAASLEPGLGFDRFLHAWYLSMTGDLARAADQARAGHRLDPLSFFGQVIEGAIHIFNGEHDRAVVLLERLIAQDPKFPEGYHLKGYSQLLRRDHAGAAETLTRAVEHSRRASWPMAKLGCALAGLGRTEEAAAILAELETRWQTDPTCPSAIATLHLHLGDRAAYFRWMDQALEDREPFCVALRVERLWESAWDDPAYRELVRKVGIPWPGMS